MCKIAFEPDSTEGMEVLLLKDYCVESIGIVDEILEMFQSQKRGEGGMLKGFEKFVESVGPEMNNNHSKIVRRLIHVWLSCTACTQVVHHV